MNLKIITPLEVFNVDNVSSIHAEGLEGHFTILPHHADYVSALTSSIFSYERNGKKEFFAVDGGVLVKHSDNVELSFQHAVRANNIKELKTKMEEAFYEMTEEDKKTRTALALLEGNIAKLLQDLGNN